MGCLGGWCGEGEGTIRTPLSTRLPVVHPCTAVWDGAGLHPNSVHEVATCATIAGGVEHHGSPHPGPVAVREVVEAREHLNRGAEPLHRHVHAGGVERSVDAPFKLVKIGRHCLRAGAA